MLAAALGACLGLVALELVMQVVALAWWREVRAAQTTPRDSGERTVLCVGDSFTFGLGGSHARNAYPAVLADLLQASRPGRWRVVNRGVPSRDSGDVLARLPAWLEGLEPAAVCMLVGYNDRWHFGAEVHDGERVDPEAFVWKLRSLELLRRIAVACGIASGPENARAVRPRELLGAWHAGPMEFVFDADGRARLAGSEFVWRASGDTLHLGVDGSAERSVSWRLEGDELELAGDWYEGSPLRLHRGPAEPDPETRARAALAAGRIETARAAAARIPDVVRRRRTATEIAAAAGDGDAIAAGLEALRTSGDRRAPEQLACTLLAIGRIREGFDAARELVASDARLPWLWRAAGDVAQRHGEHAATVVGLLDDAVATVGGDEPWLWRLLTLRAILRERAGGDPAASLADALRAGLLQDSFYTAVDMVLRAPERFDAGVVDAARARLSLDPDEKRRVDAALQRARGEMGSTAARYERHLRRAAELCRRHGARLLLLTYPEPTELDGVLQRVAATTDAELLDVRPAFAAAIAERGWDALFVLDGHCNDAGYRLLAGRVAERLLEPGSR